MYCPKCLNDSLALSTNGVVNVVINGKQMDAGRFLFNLKANKKEQVIKDLEAKLEEFFKWYSGFQNKEPITRLSLTSPDFVCGQGCRIPLNTQFSVIDIIIPRKEVIKKLTELGEKYHLDIQLEEDI